jgi:hypothetical protein
MVYIASRVGLTRQSKFVLRDGLGKGNVSVYWTCNMLGVRGRMEGVDQDGISYPPWKNKKNGVRCEGRVGIKE